MSEGELKKLLESGTVLRDVVSNSDAFNLDAEMITKEYVYQNIDEAKKDLFSLYPKDERLKEALRRIAKEEPDNTYAIFFVKLEHWFGDRK